MHKFCSQLLNLSEFQSHPSFHPARMKKIHSKVKALEWSQHFSHCKSRGIFQTLKGI